jgi:hypothetical protein
MGLESVFPGEELFFRQLVDLAGLLDGDRTRLHCDNDRGLTTYYPSAGVRRWQCCRTRSATCCIHPGTTRTERTPSLLAARAAQLGVSPEEAERQDFAPDSPRGNAICRMVDAAEVAFVAVFLASDKAWAVSGELVAASGGAGRSVYY